MKVLTTGSFGRSVSFVCNQITKVQENTETNGSWIFTSDGHSVAVDMHYLEVIGFLKGLD